MNWIISVFKMEMRQLLTYRADFWVNFLGHSLITFTLAYFLWSSIFTYNQVETLNSMTMNDMIIYYLLAPQMLRIQQGSNIGNISREIYEGSLNKYLLYPVNYYTFKLTTYLAHVSFYIFQLFFVILIYKLVINQRDVLDLSILKVVALILVLYLSSLVYFMMSSIIELIAFWADNIWSLSIILRMMTSFLGGAMIPLSFFPEWSQNLINYTPFPYLISFPISILLEEISIEKILSRSLLIIVWAMIFFVLSQFIWHKGKYKYSGVGI